MPARSFLGQAISVPDGGEDTLTDDDANRVLSDVEVRQSVIAISESDYRVEVAVTIG